MSSLPWFPLWVDPWLESRTVRAMPRHIRSMYMDVLCELWKDGPISDDEETFRALLNEHPKTFKTDWPRLRAALFEIEPGRLSDHKLEEIRAEQVQKSTKQAKRAKDGWEKRKRLGYKKAPAMPRHSGGDAILEGRDQRSGDLSPAGARASGPPPEPEPDPSPELYPTPAGRLGKAWSNGGLHGTPTRDQLQPLAEALEELEIDPLAACRAWCDLLRGWREGPRSVIVKQTAEKMLEHLRCGLIEQVIKGEIDPRRLAEPPPQRGAPAPNQVAKRTAKTAGEVLADEEAYRARLNAEREAS